MELVNLLRRVFERADLSDEERLTTARVLLSMEGEKEKPVPAPEGSQGATGNLPAAKAEPAVSVNKAKSRSRTLGQSEQIYAWRTVADAAEQVGVPERLIRRLIEDGNLTCVRFFNVSVVNVVELWRRLEGDMEFDAPLSAFQEWAPMQTVLEMIGCFSPASHSAASRAASRGAIRSHKTGPLRFVNVLDTERWWARRSDGHGTGS